MAVDVDLDGGVPGQRAAAIAPATSAITRERSPAARLGLGFAAIALLLAGLAAGTAWGLGTGDSLAPVEEDAAQLAFGLAEQDLASARGLSAVATGLTVLGTAFAGRSLSRSDVGGLLAAALVGLDPSLLAHGRLATPTALTVACLAVALACFLSARLALPWAGAFALALATFADPRALLWGPALLLMTLLRGHIYASPRHLGVAATQAIVIPAIGVPLHWVADGMWAAVPECLAPGHWSSLVLHAATQPGPGLLAQPNPVTWFAGAGALLFLGVGGVLFGATRFRLARANGRMQARLVAPYPAVLGRGVWLLLLAMTLAIPQAWLLLFALALALGVQDLGEDAPGFGVALAGALLLFAALVLWRSWDAVAGGGGPDAVQQAIELVPWAQPSVC